MESLDPPPLPDDAGEKWLLANDSDYEGEGARREIPWGTGRNIESLLERSSGPHRYHGTKARIIVGADSRACWWCEQMYVPNTKWQRHCSDRCRKQAFRAKKKGTHSDGK